MGLPEPPASIDDLLEQNETSIKELERLFGPFAGEAGPIDGLLKDYVDPRQNSQELVRSVRDDMRSGDECPD